MVPVLPFLAVKLPYMVWLKPLFYLLDFGFKRGGFTVFIYLGATQLCDHHCAFFSGHGFVAGKINFSEKGRNSFCLSRKTRKKEAKGGLIYDHYI